MGVAGDRLRRAQTRGLLVRECRDCKEGRGGRGQIPGGCVDPYAARVAKARVTAAVRLDTCSLA
jgi:hypothetical protein